MNYINKFFNGIESHNYFGNKKNKIKIEVSQIKDDEINNCDFGEWSGYLTEKYYIVPIKLFEENIEKTIIEEKVRRYNPTSRFYSFEPQYYDIDGVKISFEIPFDGEPDLFNIKPSTFIFTNFDVQGFGGPNKDKCGYFKLDFNIQNKNWSLKEIKC